MSIFKTIASALTCNNKEIKNLTKKVDKHSTTINEIVTNSELPTIELDLGILNLSDLSKFNASVSAPTEIVYKFLGFTSELDFAQNLNKLHNRKFKLKSMDRHYISDVDYFEVYSSSIQTGSVFSYYTTNVFILTVPFYDSNGDQYELFFQTNDYDCTGIFLIVSRHEEYQNFATNLDLKKYTQTINNVNYVYLLALVRESSLIPGQSYRIQDYCTYTGQINTQSTKHPFDLIVTATSTNTLDHKAKAVLRNEDTYFVNSDLESWEIWYDIENDTSKYSWAIPIKIQVTSGNYVGEYLAEPVSSYNGVNYKFKIAVNSEQYLYTFADMDGVGEYELFQCSGSTPTSVGKCKISQYSTGVIYRMIDEYGNDCPYDFKNIQFARYKITSTDEQLTDHLSTIENKYIGIKQTDLFPNYMPTNLSIVSDDDYKWLYTFSHVQDGVVKDLSIEPNVCQNNIIKRCLEASQKQTLNDIVIAGSEIGIHKNSFDPDCFCMTIGDLFNTTGDCFCNKFGQYSRANILLGTSIQQNAFGENAAVNLIVGNISQNNIYNYFQNNLILSQFTGNTIGIQFNNNTIHGVFNQNTFGIYTSNNVFYGTIKSNTFGGQTNYNTLTDIQQNNFGFGFQRNKINYMINTSCANMFQYNDFARVTGSTFGNGCRYNTSKQSSDVSSTTRAYLQGCHFGDYVWYVNLYNSTEGSADAILRGVTVASCVQGSESNYISIDIPINLYSETKVARNSQGDITISSGGGSSSGSGVYSEVNHGTSDTTFTLTPNTFHIWDEVSALTLTLGSETSGVANEFLFQFTSGSEPTTLTMSDDIKWTEELVIDANRIYQVSILKGLASVLSWEKGRGLIQFYDVYGNSLTAEEGMTWSEFISSDYNTLSYTFNGYYVGYTMGLVSYNGVPVYINDNIVENGIYGYVQGSGGGGN